MRTKILLAATVDWPSVARYASGFAVSGCSVEVLTPKGAPACVSRYVDKCHAYNAFRPLRALRRAIQDSGAALVVACDDRIVHHLVRLYEEEARSGSPVARLIETSLGSPQNYGRLISRNESLAMLREAGVRVPPTFAAASEADLEKALEKVGFPAVLKQDGSWGGDGVIIVRDRTEALQAYRRLATPPSRLRSVYRAVKRRDPHHIVAALKPPRRPVSVQGFVEGAPAASAFAAWKGEVVGSIYYDVLVADREIGPPNVIRRVDCPEIHRATEIVARSFGLSGLHGIDFIRDKSGAVHLIEVNPRATQGGTLAFGKNRDLPASLAAKVAPNIAGLRKAIIGDVVVFFPREWVKNPASPYLAMGHHDVPWDDPGVLKAALSF
ncbi:MAG: ATP-grasp domain-containing protein [Alphaproteobacteria bacterium]|nr:ATP-grasp domain-containing protein [Alphaproteobacteria bacterium]